MAEVYVAEINFSDTFRLYEIMPYLHPDKKRRVSSFFKKEDAARALAGEMLARKIISQKIGAGISDILFNIDEYEKPYLSGNDTLHFNISHSGSFAAFIIGKKPVGVDIEKIEPVDLNIADRYFTPLEREYTKYDLCRFYDIWTLKESYIKAAGKGMHIPLDSFSIKVRDNTIEFLGEDKRKPQFKLFYLNSNYRLSACSFDEDIDPDLKIITL